MTSKYTCSICLGNFTKPKLLPCHHTFCQQCIDDLIKAQARSNKFNCPTCRQQTEVPSGGASQFVANFYLEDDEDDKQYRYSKKHKNVKKEPQTQTTFTSNFSLNRIVTVGVDHYSDIVIIQGLPWCVICVRHKKTSVLSIGLVLKKVEEETIESVTASSTVKLLNNNDERKSVIAQGTRTFTPGDNRPGVYIYIYWDELQDVTNGYTDSNKIFTVQATVNITDIK